MLADVLDVLIRRQVKGICRIFRPLWIAQLESDLSCPRRQYLGRVFQYTLIAQPERFRYEQVAD